MRAPWQATLRRDAAGGEVERALPGEVVSSWERDASGRPRVHRTARGGEPLMGTGYRWRSHDQIAALIDVHAGPTWFEHDARSYLVAAARPDGSVQYRAPDAVGNVYRSPDRSDRTYGRGGRLEAAGGVRYVHDDDGQIVERVMPDGKRWLYAWDHAGQLREVVRPDGQRVTFGYDALGRRVRKTSDGRTTTFVWDGNDLVHEVTEGEALVTWEFEPGTFAPIAKVEGDRRYGVVTDHLGTPVALFDEGGEIAWKAQVDLYGVAREEVARTGCPWRWPGQYEDEETGLYYNQFRYYDAEGGRYISQDLVGLAGGTHLYSYPLNPLVWTDVLGLRCRVHPIANDYISKGVHLTASNGIELAVRPAYAGGIVFRAVFSGESAAALRDAIREAEEELINNASFRAKLLDTARGATRYLVDMGAAAKSAETAFLAKALENW
ncbi:hypothetical protein SCE1572_50190 [Sorangium cellulosum So0157-2]|uniref:Teneurin-like YD-shell domain-containing protein n=2 Tax=Sorangium cellulosum TaxID=56 RepID=S4Y926_SORCE|nr:hypothetical protein SCE1572_50190 [Sorangium cellulosum So0157-2]